MSLKKIWNQFVDKYMRNTMERIDGTEFPEDETVRYRIVFSGLVQGVGFRYETWAIAQKLGLIGYVENLSNGDVYTEIQGAKNKILYLIECLQSIPRIHIENLQIDEIDVITEIERIERKEEKGFEIAN